MTEIAALFLMMGLFICLVDWRKGMLVCIAVGFLSDPVRKLVEGQPVYLVVMVGVSAAATILGFYLRHGHFRLRHLGALHSKMKVPVSLFLILIIIQAAISLVKYGSPILVGLGLLSYLAPIPGFLIAFYYGRNTNNVILFMKWYLVLSILMLSGIYLSYYGVEWSVLKEVGEGVKITMTEGILDAFPGFLRSTEVAAWHTAMTISFIIILSISSKLGWPKIVVAGAIIALIVAGLLTGRRKMLMEVFLFVSFYGLLLFWFKQGANRLVLIGVLAIGLVGLIGIIEVKDNQATQSVRLDPYLSRGSTVFGDADDRFSELGLASVSWAINGYGYFGGGLGVATQGAQHFGGGAVRFGGAGEGGLGKIVAELGLPGLFLAIWIAVALFSHLWKVSWQMARFNLPIIKIYYGLIALLMANVPLYIVATQVFGDLFVLLLLGWILGFAVAISQAVLNPAPSRVRPQVNNGVSHHRLYRGRSG